MKLAFASPYRMVTKHTTVEYSMPGMQLTRELKAM